MKKKDNTLLLAQKAILQNLYVIQDSYTDCINRGIADVDNEIYNQIAELIDDVNSITTREELDMIVISSKALEKRVDAWLASFGQTSVSLTWPIPPYEE